MPLKNNKRNVDVPQAPVSLPTTRGQDRITACAVIGCRGGEKLASNLAQTADFNPRVETVAEPEQGGCGEDGGPGSLPRASGLLAALITEAALILTTA